MKDTHFSISVLGFIFTPNIIKESDRIAFVLKYCQYAPSLTREEEMRQFCYQDTNSCCAEILDIRDYIRKSVDIKMSLTGELYG